MKLTYSKIKIAVNLILKSTETHPVKQKTFQPVLIRITTWDKRPLEYGRSKSISPAHIQRWNLTEQGCDGHSLLKVIG